MEIFGEPIYQFLDYTNEVLKDIIDKLSSKYDNSVVFIANVNNGKIVFISSLRLENDFNELVKAFKQAGFKVIGSTKRINDDKSQEILAYLAENDTPRYLILDDENLAEVPEIQEHFIQTPTDDGLEDYLVEEAVTQVNKNNQRRLVLKK